MVKAKHLKILITKDEVAVVDLSMPARCARWIIELVPSELLSKIKERGIDLEIIQAKFIAQEELYPCELFELVLPEKKIKIWLE